MMSNQSYQSYNSQLNKLFTEWKEKSLENGDVIFTEDGLMEKAEARNIDVEKEWRESSKRIMFLLKDQPSTSSDDARLWLRDKNMGLKNCELKSRFIRNIANIFWGLYHADREHLCTVADMKKSFDEIKECFNTKPFAFIECKKQGGGTTISNNTLKEYLERYGDFLKREIDILQPNMIVCTSSIIYKFVCRKYNQEEELIKIDDKHNSIRFHRTSGTLIFCSYHPSARKSHETVYEGVMDHYRAFLKSDYAKNI